MENIMTDTKRYYTCDAVTIMRDDDLNLADILDTAKNIILHIAQKAKSRNDAIEARSTAIEARCVEIENEVGAIKSNIFAMRYKILSSDREIITESEVIEAIKAEAEKLEAETDKLRAESEKLNAEANGLEKITDQAREYASSIEYACKSRNIDFAKHILLTVAMLCDMLPEN